MIRFRMAPYGRVQSLLDSQKKALLAGDLESLETMSVDLEKALERVKSEGISAEDAARLRDAAHRNAQMVKAAQLGVDRVRQQLHAARQAPLTTYDAQGRSQAGSTPPVRTLARR